MRVESLEQLIFTIKKRMERGGAYTDYGSFAYYDLNNPEGSAHLNGLTFRLAKPKEDDFQILQEIFTRTKAKERDFCLRLPQEVEGEYGEFLLSHGFIPAKGEGTPVLDRHEVIQRREKHQVQWWQEGENKRLLEEVIGSVFELSPTTMKKLLLHETHIAYIQKEDRPVSAGILTLEPTSQWAGLYYISTLPKERGRGLGKDLVTAMTNQAFTLGAQAVTLQASALGEVVYRALGYEETGRFKNYHRPGKDKR